MIFAVALAVRESQPVVLNATVAPTLNGIGCAQRAATPPFVPSLLTGQHHFESTAPFAGNAAASSNKTYPLVAPIFTVTEYSCLRGAVNVRLETPSALTCCGIGKPGSTGTVCGTAGTAIANRAMKTEENRR